MFVLNKKFDSLSVVVVILDGEPINLKGTDIVKTVSKKGKPDKEITIRGAKVRDFKKLLAQKTDWSRVFTKENKANDKLHKSEKL